MHTSFPVLAVVYVVPLSCSQFCYACKERDILLGKNLRGGGRGERGGWSREPAKTSFVRRCAAGGIDNKQYNIMTKAKNITLKGTSKGRSGNQK